MFAPLEKETLGFYFFLSHNNHLKCMTFIRFYTILKFQVKLQSFELEVFCKYFWGRKGKKKAFLLKYKKPNVTYTPVQRTSWKIWSKWLHTKFKNIEIPTDPLKKLKCWNSNIHFDRWNSDRAVNSLNKAI